MSCAAGVRGQAVQPAEMQLADRFAKDRASAMMATGLQLQSGVTSVTQGWSTLHTGWSVNHRVLQLKGKQFETGFGSHADCAIEYRLPVGAKHLSGLCGIDDTEEARQNLHQVAFSVAVDGRPAWHGNAQTALDDASRFDVDVTGATSVTFIAKATGEFEYTPADFVDLHLTLADGSAQELGQRRSLAEVVGPGVSFVYGSKPSAQFLNDWPAEKQDLPETPLYTSTRITRTDPATHLQCIVTTKQYKHFPVAEWTVNFKNGGTQDSLMLENIKSMDLSFPATDKLFLHYHSGDYAEEHSYEPHVTEMVPGSHLTFAPDGGRPTDTAWPYYNLENPVEHSGVIAVVGWSGEWSADFSRPQDKPDLLTVSAGQQLTHFILHPGEEARAPLSVLMFYHGDSVSAQNMWRRWMLAENIPHPYGKLPAHVNAASLGLHQSEKSETNGIALFTSHGANLNYWWMDAGWYPCKNWWDGVGSWRPDPVRFPTGVKAVSDSAHAHGLKLILWIEPERAVPGSDLYKQHPEFLLGKDGSDKLLNLGDPAAWAWIVNRVDDILTTQGIDLYRQDFNEPPLSFWRANDAPDRQGITEMRHIEGYLRFWDELHARHPDMLIDTCASGGRRLDLETLRRSVPLWRSDDSADNEHNQCQTYGMASWVPMFGSGVGCDSSYVARSEMAPFFTLGLPSDGKPIDWDLYRREAGNWAKIKEEMMGDYYPLLPYSRDMHTWIAWQFNRRDTNSGVVQAFRRPNSPFHVAQFPLFGLDAEAMYTITNLDTPDQTRTIVGKQLMTDGIEVRMDTAPSAAIITYLKK